MIIIMTEIELNKSAVNKLSGNNRSIQSYFGINFDDDQDEVLTILDLRADKTFLDMFSGESLADFLYEKKLPKNVKKLELIISDINPNNNLPAFADSFIKRMENQYQKEMTVSTVTDINYDITFINPPSIKNQSKWQVYGIKDEKLPKDKKINLENLLKNNKKTLLWAGEDISKWMSENIQKNFTSARSFNFI